MFIYFDNAGKYTKCELSKVAFFLNLSLLLVSYVKNKLQMER